MFSVHCPTHGGEILLSTRHIEGLRTTEHGIELHWRCVCGTRGTLLTGMQTPPMRPVTAPARTSDVAA
ncbi:MAG: hypothetical protein ACRD29_18305 [Acidimicrobiales bacterium]